MDGQTSSVNHQPAVDYARLEHSVIYRLSIASFADSDDNGSGDVHGIIDHLDYIASLGVDVIQLAGVTSLPTASGDDGITVNGAPDQAVADYLRQLIYAAGQRDLMVLPDGADDPRLQLQYPLLHLRNLRQLCGHINGGRWPSSGLVALEDVGLPRLPDSFGRPGYRAEIARMFALLQMTLPGIPVIYQGQELGMTDGAMIQWGYCDDPDAYIMSPAMQDDDDSSTLNFYRRIIQLRKSSLTLQDGQFGSAVDRNRVAVYLRCLGDNGVLVIANMSHRRVSPKAPMVGRLLASSYIGRTDLSDGLLQPYEVIVASV